MRKPANETKARHNLKKMVQEFSKVRTKEQMRENASWFDFAASVHNLELTKKILKELTT